MPYDVLLHMHNYVKFTFHVHILEATQQSRTSEPIQPTFPSLLAPMFLTNSSLENSPQLTPLSFSCPAAQSSTSTSLPCPGSLPCPFLSPHSQPPQGQLLTKTHFSSHLSLYGTLFRPLSKEHIHCHISNPLVIMSHFNLQYINV